MRGLVASLLLLGVASADPLPARKVTGKASDYCNTNPTKCVRAQDINGILDALSGAGDAISGAKVQASGSTTPRTLEVRFAEIVDCMDHGCVADSTTDNTSTLTAMFTRLGPSFRGQVFIPYGVKFDVPTVYAAAPIGAKIIDESAVYFYQGAWHPKYRIHFTNDGDPTANEDATDVVASGHHPAMMLLNLGTAGTTSAKLRYGSRLWGFGLTGNQMRVSFQELVSVDSTFITNPGRWIYQLRLLTPLGGSLGVPQATGTGNIRAWAAGDTYSAGQYTVGGVDADHPTGVNRYWTAAGGTTGATPPTHTAGSVSDGGVTWTYKGPATTDTTVYELSEDGRLGLGGAGADPTKHENLVVGSQDSGDTTTTVISRNTATSSTASVRVDARDSGGTSRQTDLSQQGAAAYLADPVNSITYATMSGQYGFALYTPPSLILSSADVSSTATPPASTALVMLTNASGVAKNVTDFILPTDPSTGVARVNGLIMVRFNVSTITLVHGSGLSLKGDASVTPAAGSIMTFIKHQSISSDWFEVSRNF